MAVEREGKQLGFASWKKAARRAKDSTVWRRLIHAPILHMKSQVIHGTNKSLIMVFNNYCIYHSVSFYTQRPID
jgi:hypothetical protein